MIVTASKLIREVAVARLIGDSIESITENVKEIASEGFVGFNGRDDDEIKENYFDAELEAQWQDNLYVTEDVVNGHLEEDMVVIDQKYSALIADSLSMGRKLRQYRCINSIGMSTTFIVDASSEQVFIGNYESVEIISKNQVLVSTYDRDYASVGKVTKSSKGSSADILKVIEKSKILHVNNSYLDDDLSAVVFCGEIILIRKRVVCGLDAFNEGKSILAKKKDVAFEDVTVTTGDR